ncbi:MAG: hypothetical protein ACR2HH_09675 [Chthoniobacterales bacterium]
MASLAPAQKEDRVIFTAGTIPISVRAVIDAAHFRGEVQAPWKEFLARVGAAKRADETETELDDEVVDAASVAFRYQYDLITAEETEHWLEARGVTLGDFSEYFAREHWVKLFRAKTELTLPPFQDASPEMRELFAAELIFNGQLEAMANRLAWRLAAHAAAESDVASEELEAERARFRERNGLAPGEVGAWLASLGRDDDWLEEALASEARYRSECEKLLTAQAAEREIGALRLPLTRFEVETIEFESRDAASEAVLCVRDDGMSMAEVATEGRYPYRRTEMVLEEIAEDYQQKFLSLTPGSLLEPIPHEDSFQLSRLLGKTEPDPADPRVRERITQRILQRHFAELTSKHIRWEIIPVVTE